MATQDLAPPCRQAPAQHGRSRPCQQVGISQAFLSGSRSTFRPPPPLHLCRCDLVSLAQISDVEDTLEAELGSNTRVVRTQFCRVPVDLILDTPPRQLAPPLTATSANSSEGVLSHEASAASVPCAPVGVRGERRWEPRDADADAGDEATPTKLGAWK